MTPLAISPAVLPCASTCSCIGPAGINTFVSSYVRTSLTPSIHRRFAMCLSISDRSKALLSRDSAPIRVKRREVQVRRGSRRRLLSASDASTIRGSSWRSRPRCRRSTRVGPVPAAAGLPRRAIPHARRLLGEAAWAYQGPPQIERMLYRQEAPLPKPICDIAWKAQLRLPAACAAWWRAARRSRKSLRRLRRAQGIHREKASRPGGEPLGNVMDISTTDTSVPSSPWLKSSF